MPHQVLLLTFTAIGSRRRVKAGTKGRPGPAAASRRPGHRPGGSSRAWRAILLNTRGARTDRHAATRRLHHLAETAGIQIFRRTRICSVTLVTTMLDAGADLRDVQIAARHADPRTTMRYDRARNNLDRHPNYILTAYMASGT